MKKLRLLPGLLLVLAAVSGHAEEGLDPAILAKVKAATVFLKVKTTRSGEGQGTGFLISNKMIVTNAHVLGISQRQHGAPASIQIIVNSGTPGKELSLLGSMAAFDDSADLAFVTFIEKQGLTLPEPLTLAHSKDVHETMPVYILGFPFGEALTLSKGNPSLTIGPGSVSSLRLDDDGFLAAIQINGNINPGNSGGPIINKAGQVVAVSAATIIGTQIGFSIPADALRRNLEGRIKSVTTSNATRNGDKYSFDIDIETLDVFTKLTSVTFKYWTAKPGVKRPIDPVKKLPVHGAPGDSGHNEIQLKLDKASGRWKAQAKDILVPVGRELWNAITIKGDGKEKSTAAASMQNTLSLAVANVRNSTPEAAAGRVTDGGKVVAPIVPPALQNLRAVQERDEKGQSFTRVASSAVEVKLADTRLIQIIAPPTGEALYAIFEGVSAIKIFDPATFKETGEIPLARSPVGIWCDDKRIVAACGESKIVSIIDAQAKKILRSIPMRDDPTLVPLRIVGKAPDGSFMSIWKVPEGAWWDNVLIQVDETGQSKRVLKAAIDWCTYTSNGTRLWAQHNFRGSPSGVPEWFELSTGNPINLQQNKLLGEASGFHRSFSHCFQTFDKRNLVFPTERRGESPYGSETYLVSQDLSRIDLTLPGTAVAEVPSEGIIVTWGIMGPNRDAVEVCYVSRSTGRIVRRVGIDKFRPHPACFTRVNAIPDTIYVPGHELFIFRDFNGRDGRISVIKCGPISKDVAAGADPAVTLTNDPPAKANVGQSLIFTPTFKKPDNAKKVTFKLKKSVEGMKIDANTGKLTFKPTDASIGKFDVSIAADVDGVEVPVINWVIDVGF